jgi:dephospho-CoA kinase
MKTKPLRVGLTGGIGTGKSTVAKIFNLLDVPVYDADSMAKKLMEEDSNLVTAIAKEFGDNAYSEGKLNRQFIAEKVFKNEPLLARLNALVHPVVATHFDDWANQFTGKYILKEAALLFETGSYKELDFVILVQSPLDTRIERIKQRDPQRSEEQILNIIKRQMPVPEAVALADFTIQNNEGQMVIPQVQQLHDEIIKKGQP